MLANSPAVTALTGPRIEWGQLAQGAGLPAVVLTKVSEVRAMTMNGPSLLIEGRIQVDCYARTYGSAVALSRAVTNVLHAHTDSTLRLIWFSGSRETREGGSNEAERPWRVSLDFNLAWKET